MTAAYYNEIDPFAAAWLRNLIKEGLIADGDVDERSIADVDADDLRGFRQCHFFAGIGGWSYALRLAGWPDDRPVWTGSCPCQPFSVAGKGKGVADERHLWPEFHRLIAECKPAIVFGEQVASRAGREWFAGVRADLEDVGYGAAAADLCAAGVGAPHIRQRLYWVATDMADAASAGLSQCDGARASATRQSHAESECSGGICDMANAERDGAGHFSGEIADKGRQAVDAGPEGLRRGDGACLSGGADARNQSDMADTDSPERRAVSEGRRHDDDRADAGREKASGRHQFHCAGDMADADDPRRQGWAVHAECSDECSPWSRGVEWRRGADGKARRVKPGVRLLVDGFPNRVGLLRGFGNAIVPQVAAAFIKSTETHAFNLTIEGTAHDA